MNELIPNETGAWIQCCNPFCNKWRYCRDCDDPLEVPAQWYCWMNTDPSRTDCSIPEATLDNNEIFIMSKYKAGSIVWAKVVGRPWTPAMIEFCLENENYYRFENEETNIPSHYHVKFLNEREMRAWVRAEDTKSFLANPDPGFALEALVSGRSLSETERKTVLESYNVAKECSTMNIKKRLQKLSKKSLMIRRRLKQKFLAEKPAVQLPVDDNNETLLLCQRLRRMMAERGSNIFIEREVGRNE